MDGDPDRKSHLVIVGRPNISQERRAQQFTALELERMGSDSWFELIQGRLYETWPLDIHTSVVLTELFIPLYKHIHTAHLGHLVGGAGFVFERAPDTVIAPRGAFVRNDRIPASGLPHGFFPGAPDLAIEAASSLDALADLQRKRALYVRRPVPLLWWIDPLQRTAAVHRPGLTIEYLTEDDELNGEDIIPGFSIPLATLFDF
jgi:Uma2 family endonuclease